MSRSLISSEHFVPVHVRGDGSVLHKISFQNLLSVIIRSSETESTVEDNESFRNLSTKALTLHVIDTINGQVLVSQILSDKAELPVHLAMKENRIFVQYWNSLFHRFELLSLELYHNTPDNGKPILKRLSYTIYFTIYNNSDTAVGPWKMLLSNINPIKSSNKDLNENLSMFQPFIFHKTFIFKPSSIRALGFSITKRGITPISLIAV